ncbi:MAG TPA: guanylate kinase [Vicinamibacteria bacterium]|nr:guanylate kinase [Vicinamibacteria bacterium]
MSERVPSLIVVSGPSGAGKSTILSRVLSEVEDLRFSVSHTTRGAREGESEGVQYHFVDRATFEDMQRRHSFLEFAEVHGQLYGTALAEYERAARDGVDLLLDLDVQGSAQVRRRFADAVTVFVLPPSFTDLERRLRGRGAESEGNFRRRLLAAGEELSLYRDYDYAIINDDLDRSVEALKAVIVAARCRTSRVAPLAQAILGTFPNKES